MENDETLILDIDEQSIKQEDFIRIRDYFEKVHNYNIIDMGYTVSKEQEMIDYIKKTYGTVLIAGETLITNINGRRFYHSFIYKTYTRQTTILHNRTGIILKYKDGK